ncbi:MAG: hypothetical protein N4A33_11405 [Bacteriovoracaceae bacterium]|jgi:hypothetical protein|nr:hypothetical protein [Bacteriovoracaceae bacterium]
MKKLLLTAMVLSTIVSTQSSYASSSHYNRCQDTVELKHLRKVVKRARRVGLIAIPATIMAVSPIVAPLGAVTLVAIAAATTTQAKIAQSLNKNGVKVSSAIKQLILIDSAKNPHQDQIIEKRSTDLLVGQQVGYKYEVSAQTKETFLNDFTVRLKRKFKNLSTINSEDVRAALFEIQDNGSDSWCRVTENNDTRALKFKDFTKVVVNKLLELQK